MAQPVFRDIRHVTVGLTPANTWRDGSVKSYRQGYKGRGRLADAIRDHS
jgi:hypothetical protein